MRRFSWNLESGQVRLFLFAIALLCSSMVQAEIISTPVVAYKGTEPTPGVRLIAAFKLARIGKDGTPISGISALAWDQDESLLYAVTDRGRLHHFRLELDAAGIPVAIDRVASYQLRDLGGKKLKKKWRDAESAFVLNAANAIKGDSLIVIGFEQSPRIVRYRPNGYQQGRYTLPDKLNNKQLFNQPNDMFEAVANHAIHGVVTIPQLALKGRENNAMYRIKDGKEWEYILEPEMGNSLAGLEALPDGSLLSMERAWKSFWYPLIISFKQLWISDDQLRTKKIVRLSSAENWHLDNFEGLTRYDGNQFFIASDDNQREIQQSLLYLIELELAAE